MIRVVVGLGLLLALPASVAHAGPGGFVSAGGRHWNIHEFRDQEGQAQQYFVSEGDGRNLIVVLQGSGCVPAFAQMAGRTNVPTSLQDSFAGVLGGRARLLIIEKPGIRRNDPVGSSPGQSEGCPAAFRARYSLDDWGMVVQRALADYRRSAGTPKQEALVGISEGTKTATWLARHGFRGAIASFGGEGCDGDLAGMTARAVRRQQQRLPGPSLPEELHMVEKIRADPGAVGRYAWGQTFRRWSSFGDQCKREGLERHPDPVFLAYGAKDPGADLAGIQRLADVRQARSLPVTVVRVEGGDHGLSVAGDDKAAQIFARFVGSILPKTR